MVTASFDLALGIALPPANVSRETLNRLIDYLRGSCVTMAHACAVLNIDEDYITQDDRDIIRNEIFECEGCGWWCEAQDESENDPLNCNECST